MTRLSVGVALALAIALVGSAVLMGVHALSRPRTITLSLSGSPGAGFGGRITVDGRFREVTGVLPTNLVVNGRRLSAEFTKEQREGHLDLSVQAGGNEAQVGTGAKGRTVSADVTPFSLLAQSR